MSLDDGDRLPSKLPPPPAIVRKADIVSPPEQHKIMLMLGKHEAQLESLDQRVNKVAGKVEEMDHKIDRATVSIIDEFRTWAAGQRTPSGKVVVPDNPKTTAIQLHPGSAKWLVMLVCILFFGPPIILLVSLKPEVGAPLLSFLKGLL